MLSLIFKPILKKSESEIELPIDTEISLSIIESGCMFVSLNQTAALIIVGSLEDINVLKNINKVSFNFEHIERPEFPSLAIKIEIGTASNRSFSFDYFFNTESPSELEVLKKLKIQNDFDIHFYADEVIHSKRIEIGSKDKSELNTLIDKVTS